MQLNLFKYLDNNYVVCTCCSRLLPKHRSLECPKCKRTSYYYVSTVYSSLLDLTISKLFDLKEKLQVIIRRR